MDPLTARIAFHRDLYRDDVWIERLVARQPPTLWDRRREVRAEEPAAALGMNLGRRLLRYLDHPEGYGAEFPWAKALWQLETDCRRDHPYHRAADRPHWRGSLCHELVALVIIGGWSLLEASELLPHDNPAPVLRDALDQIERNIDRERARRERYEREASDFRAVHPPPPVHHVTPGLHARECPICLRVGAQ